MKTINLILRFGLELAALAALGYWGATASASPAVRAVLGVGAPVVAAVFWGMFVAPRARIVLSSPVRMGLGFVVFAAASVALATRGHTQMATTLAGLALLNTVLILAWKQDQPIFRSPHQAERR